MTEKGDPVVELGAALSAALVSTHAHIKSLMDSVETINLGLAELIELHRLRTGQTEITNVPQESDNG